MAEIERSAVIKETYTPLWDAACVMASPQVRTLATIGGNLCSAVPSADTAPPLTALSAQARIIGPGGERTCPVEALFAGPSACSLSPDDILTGITIPVPAGTGAYLKLMRRAALDIALVGVAAYVSFDKKDICKEVRIVLGAVAPTPIRAAAAEAALIGRRSPRTWLPRPGRSRAPSAGPSRMCGPRKSTVAAWWRCSRSAPCSRP